MQVLDLSTVMPARDHLNPTLHRRKLIETQAFKLNIKKESFVTLASANEQHIQRSSARKSLLISQCIFNEPKNKSKNSANHSKSTIFSSSKKRTLNIQEAQASDTS